MYSNAQHMIINQRQIESKLSLPHEKQTLMKKLIKNDEKWKSVKQSQSLQRLVDIYVINNNK